MYILSMDQSRKDLLSIYMAFGVSEDKASDLVDDLLLTIAIEACANLASRTGINLVEAFPNMMTSSEDEIYGFMEDNFVSEEIEAEVSRVGRSLGSMVMKKVYQEAKAIKNKPKN